MSEIEKPLCAKVPWNGLCVARWKEKEDLHIFFECEGNREAWNVMGLEHIIYPIDCKFVTM
jgi:hypothetical protein